MFGIKHNFSFPHPLPSRACSALWRYFHKVNDWNIYITTNCIYENLGNLCLTINPQDFKWVSRSSEYKPLCEVKLSAILPLATVSFFSSPNTSTPGLLRKDDGKSAFKNARSVSRESCACETLIDRWLFPQDELMVPAIYQWHKNFLGVKDEKQSLWRCDRVLHDRLYHSKRSGCDRHEHKTKTLTTDDG